MLTFDTCSFRDLAFTTGFGALVCEYAEETASPAIGAAVPQMAKYYDLDRQGVLRCIRIRDDNELVGLAILIINESQHYPFPMLGVDSLYLRKPWRKGSTGLKLLAMIKAEAKALGAPGLPIMAPPGSPLDKLCQLKKLTQTHNCYWCPCDV